MYLETDRLILKNLTVDSFDSLSEILQDIEVMYAYEHAFTNAEVSDWLNKQLSRYEENNDLGLMGVYLKETSEFIGQAGLTIQPVLDAELLEIGYLFKKAHWHKGYATEACLALRDFAFSSLKASVVHSIIRDTNISSQNVAKRIGMTPQKSFVKHYYNIDMLHIVFSVSK